jgi:hypothetical protein
MGRLYLGNGTGDVDTGGGGGGASSPILAIEAQFVGSSVGLNTAGFTPIVAAPAVTIEDHQAIFMASVEILNGAAVQSVDMEIVDDLGNVVDMTAPTIAAHGSLVWTRTLKSGVQQGTRVFTVQGKSTVDNTPTAFNASLVVMVTTH